MRKIREWEVQGSFGRERQEEWNENDDEQLRFYRAVWAKSRHANLQGAARFCV